MFKRFPDVLTNSSCVHALMPVLLFDPCGWEMMVMIAVISLFTLRILHFSERSDPTAADIVIKKFNKSCFIGRKPQL